MRGLTGPVCYVKWGTRGQRRRHGGQRDDMGDHRGRPRRFLRSMSMSCQGLRNRPKVSEGRDAETCSGQRLLHTPC